MKVRSIKYYIQEAFISVFRNRLMSVTSILTVASCILILVFSYCIAMNVSYILEQLENTVGISVFIDDSLSTEEVHKLYDRITALNNINVNDTRYVSSEEALESMAKSYGENADIILGLKEEKPIRRSFVIALESNRQQTEAIAELQKMLDEGIGIVKIVHAKDTIDILLTVNNVVRVISIVIVLVLGLLSVIIIMNTIKLTVNSRRNDISIMKYVGATDWFIKWPFIIEGMIIGIIGALIPVMLASLTYGRIIDALSRSVNAITTIFAFKSGFEIFPGIMPVTILLGVFIGSIGSLLSMRKYLDV